MKRDLKIWLLAGALLLAWTVTVSAAEQSVGVHGAVTWWNDTSNSDEIEASSARGYMVGVDYSRAYGLAPRPWLGHVRLEVSAEFGWEELHGAQQAGGRPPGTQDFGNGEEYLYYGDLMLSAWPSLYRAGRFNAYAGGGGGIAVVHALGDTAYSGAWQVGGGIEIDIDQNWSAEIGYRFFRILPVDVDGLNLEYDRHTALVGLRYRW